MKKTSQNEARCADYHACENGRPFFSWWGGPSPAIWRFFFRYYTLKCVFYTSLVFFTAICLWLVGRSLVSSQPEIDDSRREVADLALARTVAELRAHAGDLRHVELIRFENDPTGYVSDTLREKIRQQGGFTLKTDGFGEKFRKMLGLTGGKGRTREEVFAAAKARRLDGVIIGGVDRLENERDGATFTGDYELYDVKRGRVAYRGKIKESTVPGKVFPDGTSVETLGRYLENGHPLAAVASTMPWHIRFLLFIAVTLLLPVMTILFIRTMVAKRSNGANAFTLGIYTVVDAILAFFMIGGCFGGLFSVLLFAGAVLLAFLYNVSFMSFALRLEGDAIS